MKRLALAALLATAALGVHAEPFFDHARVRSAEPRYETVNVAREECSRHWVNERRAVGPETVGSVHSEIERRPLGR